MPAEYNSIFPAFATLAEYFGVRYDRALRVARKRVEPVFDGNPGSGLSLSRPNCHHRWKKRASPTVRPRCRMAQGYLAEAAD